MQDHMSGRSRGFGFVTFEEDSSAEKVFEVGTMHEIGEKQVEVKAATPKGSGSLAARQQQHGQQQQQQLVSPLLSPQQQSPMRGRSSAEYDPAMMRAFASGMPGPAGYPAYPIMYGYGGRPTLMAPGSYTAASGAAASLSQYPGMHPGHYMMMSPPSGMAPGYSPAGYSYQQQQSYTPAGGGSGGGAGYSSSGMPYSPSSPQVVLPQQQHFASSGMYPSSSSPSPPYQPSVSASGRGGGRDVQRSKSSASRTKVDSASSLDAHAHVERQFKRMGLDR
jgi:hypothetical protein